MLQEYPYQQEQLAEILELLTETVCTTRKTIRVAGNDFPAEIVTRQRTEYRYPDAGHGTVQSKSFDGANWSGREPETIKEAGETRKKRISVGTRLERYQKQSHLLQTKRWYTEDE